MPELRVVLPHWLYWSGLVFFPLFAMFLYRRDRKRPPGASFSLGIGCFLLLTGGFLGVHRLWSRISRPCRPPKLVELDTAIQPEQAEGRSKTVALLEINREP